MPTLYELKQSLGMIGQQLKNKNDELSQKATDPNIDMEDIKQLETEKAGLQQRFNIVERQVQDIEEKEKAKVKDKGEAYQSLSDNEKMVKAKAEFYRHAILPNEFEKPSMEAQRYYTLYQQEMIQVEISSYQKHFLKKLFQNHLLKTNYVKKLV